MNTKKIGQVVESKFIFECAKLGIPVSQPLGDNSPYDFIIEINKRLYKVQCKSFTKRDGAFIAETHHKHGHRRNTKTPYSLDDVDFFFSYHMGDDVFAFFKNFELIATTFRIKDEVSLVKKTMRFIEDFQTIAV